MLPLPARIKPRLRPPRAFRMAGISSIDGVVAHFDAPENGTSRRFGREQAAVSGIPPGCDDRLHAVDIVYLRAYRQPITGFGGGSDGDNRSRPVFELIYR